MKQFLLCCTLGCVIQFGIAQHVSSAVIQNWGEIEEVSEFANVPFPTQNKQHYEQDGSHIWEVLIDSVFDLECAYSDWTNREEIRMHPDYSDMNTYDVTSSAMIYQLRTTYPSLTILGNYEEMNNDRYKIRNLVIDTDPQSSESLLCFYQFVFVGKHLMISSITGPKSRIIDLYYLKENFLDAIKIKKD